MNLKIDKSMVMGHFFKIAVVTFFLIPAANAFALTDIVGDWESASLDGWTFDANAAAWNDSNYGVTLNQSSLRVIQPNGWLIFAQQWFGYPQTVEVADGTRFMIDVTVIDANFTPDGDGNAWGIKPLENLAVGSSFNWWQQLAPIGGWDWWIWRPGDGNQTRTAIFDIPAQGTIDSLCLYLISNSGDYSTRGNIYYDNARIVTSWENLSALHVDGNTIKNEDGDTIVLRGVSAIDIGVMSNTRISDYIERIANKWDTSDNQTGWYPKVVRYIVCPNDSGVVSDSPLVFNPSDLDDPNNAAIYDALKLAADYTAAKGIYSIIALRYQADISTKVTEANAFWDYMAPLFANDNNVLFEIFDEPTNDHDWPTVKANSQILIDTIRRSAAHNLILVPGGNTDQNIGPAAVDPVNDANVVYSVHCYPNTWLNDNDWITTQNIEPVVAVHPVIVTAWGFQTTDSGTAWSYGTIDNYGQPLLDYLDSHGIGSIAAQADCNTSPAMFDPNWRLLVDGNMGGFVKDWLYEKKDVWLIQPPSQMTIKKCSVKAGKLTADGNQGLDTLMATGTFSSSPQDLDVITQIAVSIVSLPDNATVYSENIDCNASRLKSGVFKYAYRIPKGADGNITSLKIDFNKKTFSLNAKNVDLTGLACPVQLNMVMGNFLMTGDANEAVVNGKSRTAIIPTRLRRLFDDTLIVTSAKDSNSAKSLGDSLSVTGCIAVENMDLDTNEPNLVTQDINIIWGSQTFMVPTGSFKAYKPGRWFKCVRAEADANVGSAGRITASIDFDKCKYKISVKDCNLVDTNGVVSFGLNFADYNEAVNVTMNKGKGY